VNAATPAKPIPRLNYATPRVAPLDPRHYRTALFCGAVPLAAILVIYLLWVSAPSGFLFLVSLAVMMCGIVVFGIGSLCLLTFLVQVCRQPHSIRRHWWPRLFLAAALLLGNAAGCLDIVRTGLHVLDSLGV
jgi:hypothetical protein